MTEEEFDTLRAWGESLTEDPRPEVRAAGRAILLLASEVERLQLEIWHAHLGLEATGALPEAEAEAPLAEEPPVDDGAPADIEPALRGNLRLALARASRATRRLQPHRDRRPDA